MTILHLCSHFYPRIGGVENHVYNISLTQLQQGHNVTVITGRYADSLEYEEINGIIVLRFPAERSLARMRFWHLRHWDKYYNTDVIHVHNLMVLYSVPKLLVKRNKTVLTLHGWGGKYPLSQKSIDKVSKLAPSVASKIITVGDFVNKWYRVKSDAVIYGASQTQSENNFDDDLIYDVCILGRLAVDSGIDIYASALEKITKEFDLKIAICGDGELRQPLLNKLKKADVEFCGFVHNPIDYVAKSRICFTSGYLGIIESLQSRCNVFSVYDNPLKKDYLQFAPFAKDINIAGNFEELYLQLKSKIKSPKLSEMPASIKTATWSNIANIYQSLYEELIV